MKRYDLDDDVHYHSDGSTSSTLYMAEQPEGDYVLYEEAKTEIDKLTRMLELLGGSE